MAPKSSAPYTQRGRTSRFTIVALRVPPTSWRRSSTPSEATRRFPSPRIYSTPTKSSDSSPWWWNAAAAWTFSSTTRRPFIQRLWAPLQNWADLIGTNLKAPLFLSQAALPHLKVSRGVIINLVDIHATRPLKQHIVYGPAKAGLAMLTRSLAKDLGPEIRVNGVSPGAILWPDSAEEMPDSTKRSIIKQIALKRAGEPSDIAGAVLFLVRDAPYVTGQILAVDGGRSVGW